MLPAGKPATASITVRNTGIEPIAIGVQGRTNTQQSLSPQLMSGQTEFALPEDPSTAPTYLVPPETSRFSLTSPAQVDLSSAGLGIEEVGDLQRVGGGTTSTGAIGEQNAFLGAGAWSGSAQQIGPFGPTGAPAGHAGLAATIVTAGFDPAVSSSAGDPFDLSHAGKPLVLQPGQSGTITVTITPGGTRGTAVTGHLNVVTTPLLATGFTALPVAGSGEVIARLPYSYTIG